jgi:hypothetical protein
MMEGEMRRGLLVWIALMPMLAVANWTNAPFVPPSGTNTTAPATLPDWRALTFTNLIVEGVGHTNVCRIYAGSNVVVRQVNGTNFLDVAGLGSAMTNATGDFATAAQGAAATNTQARVSVVETNTATLAGFTSHTGAVGVAVHGLGSASTNNTGDFATAAQGAAGTNSSQRITGAIGLDVIDTTDSGDPVIASLRARSWGNTVVYAYYTPEMQMGFTASRGAELSGTLEYVYYTIDRTRYSGALSASEIETATIYANTVNSHSVNENNTNLFQKIESVSAAGTNAQARVSVVETNTAPLAGFTSHTGAVGVAVHGLGSASTNNTGDFATAAQGAAATNAQARVSTMETNGAEGLSATLAAGDWATNRNIRLYGDDQAMHDPTQESLIGLYPIGLPYLGSGNFPYVRFQAYTDHGAFGYRAGEFWFVDDSADPRKINIADGTSLGNAVTMRQLSASNETARAAGTNAQARVSVVETNTNNMLRDGTYPATGSWNMNGNSLTNVGNLSGTGRRVFGTGLNLADIDVTSVGAIQSGLNEGTQVIEADTYGAVQNGYNAGGGTRTIMYNAYGAHQYGYNVGQQTIVTGAYGAVQSGYNAGKQAIGVNAWGACQYGFIHATAAATNNGVGAIQLHTLSAGQRATTTEDGDSSILLGAGTASNKNSIVAGDGMESHGDGSVTAGGGFWGDGAGITLGVTNLQTYLDTKVSTNGVAPGSYYAATNEAGAVKFVAFTPGGGSGASTNGLASIDFVTNFVALAVTNGVGGGGSSTVQKYWTNLVSMTSASANYLYPLSTNACEIPHIYTWANDTNACDFSGTIWLWGQNTYLPDENVNRFATRFQVTRFTNVVAAAATQLVVLDASSFNNDDIVAIFADTGATGTNNPTEWGVVTNRSSNTLMLRSGVTNDYTSTSGRVHRVVRFDGLDWYYNSGLSNALPMTLDFTVAITNNIAIKVMEVDN